MFWQFAKSYTFFLKVQLLTFRWFSVLDAVQGKYIKDTRLTTEDPKK